MKARVIGALIKKDFALFKSNRFYLLISLLGLVFFTVVYFIMPADVDESFSLGMYAPETPAVFSLLASQEGLEIEYYDDEESLKQAVLDGDYQVAVALPPDIIPTWAGGGKPDIKVYYAAGAGPEVSAAVTAMIKELAYAQSGQSLNYETTEEILGPDMLGNQVALRDRMKPLLAVFILLMELLTLASLIATEIEQGTARALLVTPLRISELFTAKGLLGLALALGQSVIFMAVVGGLNHQPLIMLLTLLIGSAMVVGLGFLLAALSRDVTVVTGWGLLLLIVLAIPGFGMVIPGMLSTWTKIIPSYYLTDTVSRVVNYGAGWGDIWLNLIILAAFTAVVIWVGMAALRRRYL